MTNKCRNCRHWFTDDSSKNYKTCPKCRKYFRDYRQKWRAKTKIEDMPFKPKKHRKPTDDKLLLTVREIDDYNAEHGTNYHYGLYVALKERGWI